MSLLLAPYYTSRATNPEPFSFGEEGGAYDPFGQPLRTSESGFTFGEEAEMGYGGTEFSDLRPGELREDPMSRRIREMDRADEMRRMRARSQFRDIFDDDEISESEFSESMEE